MKSPVRAAVWFLALILFIYAVYSIVMWSTRAAPGTAQEPPPAQASDATDPALTLASSETKPAPTAEAPAQGDRPFGQLPPFQTRRTSPGEEFYSQGQYDKAIEFWEGMAKQGDIEANYRLGKEYL
jgi:TPR repeat protein